jgi:ADP-ribose pyrophosphatase YjhB (NUDIX family)
LPPPRLRPAHHVAAAIIRRGDEIALVYQGSADEELFWALPGGVVEPDELVPEGLTREVLEETGLTLHLPAPLAYVRQIDNRRDSPLAAHPNAGAGSLVTVWLFDVDSWDGEIEANDPDGVVQEACFVEVGEAAQRLRRTPWLELAASYLEGLVEPGSLVFERWNEDGTVTTPLR